MIRHMASKKESLEHLRRVPMFSACSAKDLEKVASLPTKEQALSQLLGVIKAPIQKLVATIQAPQVKLVRTVVAIRDQKQAG